MELISEEQKSAIGNIKKLYQGREKVIKLFDDYYKKASEAYYKTWKSTQNINP